MNGGREEGAARGLAEFVFACRKLLPSCVRYPVRAVNGVLPDPDLHPFGADRDNLVGELLAEPQRDARPGRPGRHHCFDHDHTHVFNQRCAAKDILRQVDRRLPGNMFRYGLRVTTW